MNEKRFRPQFNQMDTTEKQVLMENLAARYAMTFLGLHTFDRWGQSCTTGIFEKDGREFVFVPGDTVTLGWERFSVGLNQDSREELDYLFQEWEMECDSEEMIRESMAPVRQAAIGPMLVGRELEELCWEPVKMDDPRLTAHPDWLKKFRDFAWSDLDSLTLHQSARIERTEKGFQIWIYNRTDYGTLLDQLEKQGLSLPTADEWAYLCGGGCRTLFPWGDGMDYSMHLHHFERPEDEDKPFDMEEPNFFGLSIAYDPYMREVVKANSPPSLFAKLRTKCIQQSLRTAERLRPSLRRRGLAVPNLYEIACFQPNTHGLLGDLEGPSHFRNQMFMASACAQTVKTPFYLRQGHEESSSQGVSLPFDQTIAFIQRCFSFIGSHIACARIQLLVQDPVPQFVGAGEPQPAEEPVHTKPLLH